MKWWTAVSRIDSRRETEVPTEEVTEIAELEIRKTVVIVEEDRHVRDTVTMGAPCGR